MRLHRLCSQGGFMGVELAIAMPFLLVMLLLVVGLGRVSHGRQQLEQAAAAAARAAALTTGPGLAGQQARQAAADTLAQAGLSCTELQIDVDTRAFRPGGYVDVTATCRADLSSLTLTGLPGSVALSSTARSPLEAHRDFSGARS